MMRLNYKRTSPSERTYLVSEPCQVFSPRWHLGRISTAVTFHKVPPRNHFITRQCKISRTFRVPSKHYQRIFQSAHMWNYTKGAHTILEMDSNVD